MSNSGTESHSKVKGDGGSPITITNMIWPLLLGLSVLGAIAYFTYDPEEFAQLPRPNGLLLTAAAVMSGMQIVFGGWRFSYVARERFGLVAGMRFQLAWQFFSNVTPSAVGGGPASAYYMARDQEITVGDATALMLFTILLDQLWFAFTIPLLFVASQFMQMAPPALGTYGGSALAVGFIGLMLWSATFAYLTLFRPERLEKIADWIFKLKFLRRFRGRVSKEMRQLARRAQTLRMQPPSFYVKGFLITAGLWMARYAIIIFVIWSVLPDLETLLALVRSAAMLLVALVMPTPGGAGGIEGLYALFLGPLMPAALLAPTLLVWRILAYYIFIAVGVYLSAHHAQQAISNQVDDSAPEEAPSKKSPPASTKPPSS